MADFEIMIDLEGLGTNPWTTPLLQIGACLFRTSTGRIVREFLVNVDPLDAIRLGAWPDKATEDWWREQGGFSPAAGYPTLGVVAALEALSEWVKRIEYLGDRPLFWAQGITYDFGILDGLLNGPTTHQALEDCFKQVKLYVSAMDFLTGKTPLVTG